MHIAIYDDEKFYADALGRIIKQWSISRSHAVTLIFFDSAESFLEKHSALPPFDLIFLDIKMDEMSASQLAETFRKTDPSILLVFTSAFSDHWERGYDVNALHFLIKPVNAKKCMAVLDRAKRIMESRAIPSFLIFNANQTKCLPLSDIYFFDSDAHYVTAHTRTGNIRFRDKLSSVAERLPKHMFCQCHRTAIINIAHVDSMSRNQLQVSDEPGTILPFSNTYWDIVNHTFIDYHEKPGKYV